MPALSEFDRIEHLCYHELDTDLKKEATMKSEALERLHEKARQLNIPQDPLPLSLFWVNQAASQISIVKGDDEIKLPSGIEGLWFVEKQLCPDPSLLAPLVRPDLLPEWGKDMEKASRLMKEAPFEVIFSTSGGKVKGWAVPAASICVLGVRLRWIYEDEKRRLLFRSYPAELARSGEGRVVSQVLVLGYARRQLFELRARGKAGQSLMNGVREALRAIRTSTLGLDPSFFYITLLSGERVRLEQGSFYTRIHAHVPPVEGSFVQDEEARDIQQLQESRFVDRWVARVIPAPQEQQKGQEEETSRPPESDRPEDWIAWVRLSQERIAKAAAALSGGDKDLGAFFAHLMGDEEATVEQIKDGLLPGPMAETPEALVEVLRQVFS